MKCITEKEHSCSSINYLCASIGGSPMTCYVLRGKKGDMLIDTGISLVYKSLREYISHYDIRYVLLTHAHTDHDGNAARLRKELDAEIFLSGRDRELVGHFERQPVKATSPRYRVRNIQQNVCGRMRLFRSAPYTPDILLGSDRNILHEYGFDAETVPLPGHTLGSVGVLSDGVLYCGDAFTAMWGKPDITPHAASPEAMVRSLERILELSPEWLATGHGLPVKMSEARPVIRKYLLMHRHQLK